MRPYSAEYIDTCDIREADKSAELTPLLSFICPQDYSYDHSASHCCFINVSKTFIPNIKKTCPCNCCHIWNNSDKVRIVDQPLTKNDGSQIPLITNKHPKYINQKFIDNDNKITMKKQINKSKSNISNNDKTNI